MGKLFWVNAKLRRLLVIFRWSWMSQHPFLCCLHDAFIKADRVHESHLWSLFLRASITKDPFYDLVTLRKRKVISNTSSKDWKSTTSPFGSSMSLNVESCVVSMTAQPKLNWDAFQRNVQIRKWCLKCEKRKVNRSFTVFILLLQNASTAAPTSQTHKRLLWSSKNHEGLIQKLPQSAVKVNAESKCLMGLSSEVA